MTRRRLIPPVVFLLVSVPLCALWPRAAAPIARWLDEPVARLLLATNDDVVWSDHALDGARVIVLGTNDRRRLSPILAKTTSLAVPIFAALVAAAFAWAPARARLAGRRGLLALCAAAGVVVLFEALAGWLAIGYALAIDNDRTPSGVLRLATVTTNAARTFVPFAAALLAVALAGRTGDTRSAR